MLRIGIIKEECIDRKQNWASGFAVLHCSWKISLQVNLTIKIIHFWTRPIKIIIIPMKLLNRRCQKVTFLLSISKCKITTSAQIWMEVTLKYIWEPSPAPQMPWRPWASCVFNFPLSCQLYVSLSFFCLYVWRGGITCVSVSRLFKLGSYFLLRKFVIFFRKFIVRALLDQ